MHEWLRGREVLASLCFLILVVAPLRPLPSRPAFLLSLQLASAVALALAVVAPTSRAALRSSAIPLGAMLLLSGLAALQSLPLPEGLVTWLSPEHARTARAAAGLGGGPAEPAFYLSLAPGASRATAVTWLSVAALFFAAHCAGPRRRYVVAIVLGGLLQVGIGLLEGTDPEVRLLNLTGSLGAPANLAAYMEIGLASAFAAGWWAYRRGRAPGRPSAAWVALPIACWAVLLVGLLLTASRAGLAGALGGLALQALLLTPFGRSWGIVVAALVLAATGALAVWMVGPRELLFALFSSPLFEAVGIMRNPSPISLAVFGQGRLEAWSLSLEVWSRFAWLGTGAGSFWSAFQLVHPEWLTGQTFHHAHNVPLELLVTGGGVALATATVGVGWVVWVLWSRLSRPGSLDSRALALAGLGALVSVGLLDLTVFGLLHPPNAATLAILLGAATARPRDGEA